MNWSRDAPLDTPEPDEAYPAYPIDAFFKVARGAIRHVFARVQAPESIVAMTALAAMSVACQQSIDVQMPRKLLRPTSLFFFGRLVSSGRKTSAADLLLSSIVAFDARLKREHEQAELVYGRETRVWRNLEKGISRRIHKEVAAGRPIEQLQEQYVAHLAKEPRAPRERQILRESVSERALYEALEGEREAIAALADEGDTVVRGGLLNRLGVVDSLWNGKLPRRDRAYGKLTGALNPRLTLLILLPGGLAEAYDKKHGAAARDSGFYGRMLHAAPPSNVGFRTQASAEEDDRVLEEFTSRILELLEKSYREHAAGQFKPQIIHFCPDAADAWERKAKEIEECLRPGGSLREIEEFAGKALEIASRIAAIFHYFSGQVGDITVDTFERAWKIVEWHLAESKRIFYEQSSERKLEKNVERLTNWLRRQARYRYAVIEKNDVLQHNPLRTIGELRPALDVLLMNGVIDVKYESGKWMVHLNIEHFPELKSATLFYTERRH